jgi:chondroitin 4-sulfotransferase 11
MKKHICIECGLGFNKYMYLKRHIELHNDIIKSTRHTCHMCTEIFNSYKNLQNHLTHHLKPKHNGSYECQSCDKQFRTYTYLSNHAILHKLNKYKNNCPTDYLDGNRYKFVYVHIPKCGGTSLSRYFKQFSSYIIMSADNNKNEELTRDYTMVNFSHASLKYTKEPEKIISFVRNPYSRIVSLFHYQKLDRKYEFKEFIKKLYNNPKIIKMINNEDLKCTFDLIEYNYSWKNQCFWLPQKCNFIGRFEELHKSLESICKIINCPYDEKKLTHRKKSDHNEYKSYYDEETIKMVSEIYKKDLDFYGYAFD